MNVQTIDILIVDNHEQYLNKRAILLEDKVKEVIIVNTRKHNATVRHKDGQLQKAVWNRLLVESK
jgi:hypothetical protein